VPQVGGALGAYQAGVFEGLADAKIEPHWVAGVPIGAINAALIAGNPPAQRVQKLRQFWQTVTAPPLLPARRATPRRARRWAGLIPSCVQANRSEPRFAAQC
jgi:NTE family protein